MKTLLAGIPALADGVVCELYAFFLKSGEVLRYTSYQYDLNFLSNDYLSDVLLPERGAIRSSVGIKVDDVEISLYTKTSETVVTSDMTLGRFVNEGRFNGARVVIWRARNEGAVHLFEGLVSESSADRTKATLKVSAPTILLDRDMPRENYQLSCVHTVFNAGCGLSKNANAHGSTVLTGSTKSRLLCGLGQAAGFFDLGTLTFLGGANNGFSRTIKEHKTGELLLAYPLPFAPAIGDEFEAYPGCDGLRATCVDKFDNLDNFLATPFMPAADASI